jgi:hypothetical protein
MEQGHDTVNEQLREVLIANAKALGGTVAKYAAENSSKSFGDLSASLAKHRLIKVSSVPNPHLKHDGRRQRGCEGMSAALARCALPNLVPRLHPRQSTRHRSCRQQAVYLAIGVNMAGHKEVLGLWICSTWRLTTSARSGRLPVRDWRGALNRFMMQFEDRMSPD